jgi:glycosyltransferase involved in cell wall biosynthesis
MNILMVTEIYLPIWGGAENQLRQLIPHLVKKGCNVSIVTRRWHQEWQPEDYVDGVKVIRLGVPGRSRWGKIAFILSLLKYLFIKRKEVDILHSHGSMNMGALCGLAGKLFGVKNVSKIATAGRIPPLQGSVGGRTILIFFKKSNAIISMTKEIDDELKEIKTPPENIYRITNGVDSSRFKPAESDDKESLRKQYGLKTDCNIIIFSGRLVYRKGLDLLLSAWPEIANKHLDSHLFIVGDGKNQADSIEKEMKKKVESEHLPRVIFHGATEEAESLLRLSDVFVFPSRKEGFPNALMEALSTGLVVLASDIGGVKPLITNNKNGVLFKTEDAISLREMLDMILSDMDKYKQVGLHARSVMLEDYSFDRVSREYVNLYSSLLKG